MNIEIGNSNAVKIETGIVQVYPNLENLEVTPSNEEQIFNHPNSFGYDVVKVLGDINLIPENIKKGVSIFGIVGTLEQTENTLTPQQIQAINNMTSTINKNGELILDYDETMLDINYMINENGELIFTDNTGLIDSQITNEELEVIY